MPQASKMFLGENLFQILFRLSVKSQKRNDQQTFHLRITSVAHKNEQWTCSPSIWYVHMQPCVCVYGCVKTTLTISLLSCPLVIMTAPVGQLPVHSHTAVVWNWAPGQALVRALKAGSSLVTADAADLSLLMLLTQHAKNAAFGKRSFLPPVLGSITLFNVPALGFGPPCIWSPASTSAAEFLGDHLWRKTQGLPLSPADPAGPWPSCPAPAWSASLGDAAPHHNASLESESTASLAREMQTHKDTLAGREKCSQNVHLSLYVISIL